MEKLKLIKATVFYDDTSAPNMEEILIPIEAIAHLVKSQTGHEIYNIVLKVGYPISTVRRIKSINASTSLSKLELL